MAINVHNAELLISAGRTSQFPSVVLPQVAMSGRSNVGKSSLINTLLGRKSLARVSSTPGKTVTVNFYGIDKKLILVDLPGYGFAKRAVDDKKRWSALTDGFFTDNKNADLLCLTLQLVDLTVGPTADDVMMIEYMKALGLPFVIVASKADKPNKTERAAAEARLRAHPAIPEGTLIIPFSSKTGEGRDDVWRAICDGAQV